MTHDGGLDGEPRRPRKNKIIRLLLAAGLLLAVGGALAAALSGFGHRWAWWPFSTGFSVLRWAVYASLAGVAASTAALLGAALLKRGRLAMAALPAIALGAAVISVPLDLARRASHVPPIHDISTDLDDPPDFVALRSQRVSAPNGAEYPGEATARLQRDAYPDVVPIRLSAGHETVFAAAETIARDLGWRIIEADPAEGRIEAVDRTFWFGFRDDVVIRITGGGRRYQGGRPLSLARRARRCRHERRSDSRFPDKIARFALAHGGHSEATASRTR